MNKNRSETFLQEKMWLVPNNLSNLMFLFTSPSLVTHMVVTCSRHQKRALQGMDSAVMKASSCYRMYWKREGKPTVRRLDSKASVNAIYKILSLKKTKKS